MKVYVKTYLDYFGYGIDDYIVCECCGKARAADIHHIWARSVRPDLFKVITNLMALCRKCHDLYGDWEEHREMLQSKHNEVMDYQQYYKV